MSIFNPWGALRQARQELAEAQFKNELGANELLCEIARRETDRKEFELRQRILHAEIERLKDLVQKAHFRNPKTGRIGKKGERFK